MDAGADTAQPVLPAGGGPVAAAANPASPSTADSVDTPTRGAATSPNRAAPRIPLDAPAVGGVPGASTSLIGVAGPTADTASSAVATAGAASPTDAVAALGAASAVASPSTITSVSAAPQLPPAPSAPATTAAPTWATSMTPSAPTPAGAISAASAAAAAAPAESRTAAKPSGAREAENAGVPSGVTLSPTSRLDAATPVTPGTASTAPAPAAPPLNTQLAPTLLNLRTAAGGTHVLTMTVSPDEVGPVTVRAHVAADGIRIELSAPTEQGRDALGAMLPELRRDLSQGGMNAGLSLASGQADGSGAGQQPGAGASGAFDRDARTTRADSSATDPELSARSTSPITRIGATSALDVFA